jgi:hypothetical protein
VANLLGGDAKVELSDGRVLHFAYDFDGMIALEEASGMKMSAVQAELQRLSRTKEEPSMRLTRAIIYGGLQQYHPEMTLKDAGEIILTETAAIARAFEALSAAHGPQDEGGEAGGATADPPKAPARGTGASSSKAGAPQGSSRRASAGKRRGPTPGR